MSRLAAEVRTSSDYVRRSSSGSFAILAAIRRASSRVSSLAAMSASDCVQLQQGFATGVMRADRQFDGKNYRDRMSALGHKRTLECVRVMSALPPKADIVERDHLVPAVKRHGSHYPAYRIVQIGS